MKWFRFYSEAVHDPKVQTLRPELFKFWVNLLCLANESKDRGTLPTVDELAFVLRLKRSHVTLYINSLVALKLIDEGEMTPQLPLTSASPLPHLPVTSASAPPHLPVTSASAPTRRPHNWDGRQRQSDDVAKRVKVHRQKTSGKSTDANGHHEADTSNVTSNVTGNTSSDTSNVTVTPRGREIQIQRRGEEILSPYPLSEGRVERGEREREIPPSIQSKTPPDPQPPRVRGSWGAAAAARLTDEDERI